MTVLKMFALRDKKAQAYSQPMFMRNSGEAIRSFSDAINDSSTVFGKYPEDFALFEVGDFNDETGKASGADDHPLHIINGLDLLKPKASAPDEPSLPMDLPRSVAAPVVLNRATRRAAGKKRR